MKIYQELTNLLKTDSRANAFRKRVRKVGIRDIKPFSYPTGYSPVKHPLQNPSE